MRKEVFVLVLALLLAIAGCTSGDNNTTTSSNTPFVGGAEGLRVSFVDNAPPREILDNPKPQDESQVMRFEIAVKLDNMGEQEVLTSNIKTTLGGIYPPDFDKSSTDLQNVIASAKLPNVLKIEGVRKDPEGDKLPGGTEEMTFKDLGYLKSLAGNNEFPVQADVCYKYTTKAVGNFCMRQDMTRTSAGVCTVKGAKQMFSSGAPVQVTTLDESVGGRNKVILKFRIKAVGAGSFFKPDPAGTPPTCTKGDFSKENFVQVTVNTGVNGLTCSGFSSTGSQSATGQVRLANGEASVTCIQDMVTVDALQSVNVQVEYNHLISTATSILVKHLPADSQTSSQVSAECVPGQIKPCTTGQNCQGQQTCYSGGTYNYYGTCLDVPNDNCPLTAGISISGCGSNGFLPSDTVNYNSYKTACDKIPGGSTQPGAWVQKLVSNQVYYCCVCTTVGAGSVWVDLSTGCSSPSGSTGGTGGTGGERTSPAFGD